MKYPLVPSSIPITTGPFGYNKLSGASAFLLTICILRVKYSPRLAPLTVNFAKVLLPSSSFIIGIVIILPKSNGKGVFSLFSISNCTDELPSTPIVK